VLEEIYGVSCIIDFHDYLLNSREITIPLPVEKMAKISAFSGNFRFVDSKGLPAL
jgi:hypothetical protein